MYLSKLILNPRCREVRRDIGSPYELHRTLSHGFTTEPGVDYRAAHGVLFRLEPLTNNSSLPTVLVQSLSEPNWHELPEVYLHTEPGVRAFSPTFSGGQLLAFRLVANPTRKEKREGRSQGRRVALLDSLPAGAGSFAEQPLTPARSWLARKGEQHGFRVIYATTSDSWQGVNGRGTAKNALPLYGVRYEGVLQVTNSELLQQGLATGIGPAKAFGFGLLSVARVQ